MSNAFVVYVRNEEQVLLMKRADSVSEFPLAWDGIFGVGDANDLDVVLQRIKEATGIESDKITHIRTGEPRGLAFGNVLNEVCLLYTSPSPRDVEESRMPSSA